MRLSSFFQCNVIFRQKIHFALSSFCLFDIGANGCAGPNHLIGNNFDASVIILKKASQFDYANGKTEAPFFKICFRLHQTL